MRKLILIPTIALTITSTHPQIKRSTTAVVKTNPNNHRKILDRAARKNALTLLTRDKSKKKQKHQLDSFYNPEFDYSKFTGRITDRDKSSHIIKVKSSNKNIKLFQSGDKIIFQVFSKDTDFCKGYIRTIENNYFVAYVSNIFTCFESDQILRRGVRIVIQSQDLAKRVKDAAIYRLILLKRRESFFSQLNDVNHFIWTYDQQKVITASRYDKEIEKIKNNKQNAIDQLISKKADSIKLQKNLNYSLDRIDQELELYRISEENKGLNRWSLDHNLGLPVDHKPQSIRFWD